MRISLTKQPCMAGEEAVDPAEQWYKGKTDTKKPHLDVSTCRSVRQSSAFSKTVQCPLLDQIPMIILPAGVDGSIACRF